MKHLSLTENHLFGKAYSNGKRYCSRHMCVFVLRDRASRRIMKANPEKKQLNRIGLTVSKKIGGAVVRSRARRVMRAALDTVEARLKTGFIIVISAREGIAEQKSTELATELARIFAKLDMLADTQTSL